MRILRYQLIIDKPNQPREVVQLPTLEDAWRRLDLAYSTLPDTYADEIRWVLLDLFEPRYLLRRLPGGLWFAFCESPEAFSLYIRTITGWRAASPGTYARLTGAALPPRAAPHDTALSPSCG